MSRTARMLRTARQRPAAPAALALALVAAVGTVRYNAVHPTGSLHVVVVVFGVALVTAGVGCSAAALRGSSGPSAAFGLVLLTVVLVVAAPSAAWVVIPLVIVLQTTAPPMTATIASGVAVVVAAVSMPRLTGTEDPGLVVACVLAGMVFLAAVVLARSALHSRAQSLRALVAARSQLVATERRASVLAERQRVAAELHDTVVQSAAGALFLADAADRSGDRRVAEEARRALHLAVQDARALVDRLDLETPQEASLADGLAEAAARVGATVVTTGEPGALSTLRVLALLRTVQGALGNAERHAGAGTITVELRWSKDVAAVVVTDDGCGFDVERTVDAGPNGGHGLAMLRRRLEAVAGTFAISSGRGGTVVVGTVPTETA